MDSVAGLEESHVYDGFSRSFLSSAIQGLTYQLLSLKNLSSTAFVSTCLYTQPHTYHPLVFQLLK